MSSSTIDLLVSDINDNPTKGLRVDLEIISGYGELSFLDSVTDFTDRAQAVLRAGTKPGPVTIRSRVTSKVPTQEELEDVLNPKLN